MRCAQELEVRWYDSLASGSPDYLVYDDDNFISELWSCWVIYSRACVLSIKPLIPYLSVRSVADIGCGIGYTTRGLAELFPGAGTYGTNIENTWQYRFASKASQLYPSVQAADLIFASEYFEHFQRPIEHLLDVLLAAQPRYLVIANAFGAKAIGHFNTYLHGAESIENKKVGRRFNHALREKGYRLIKTGFWNNRPAVWAIEDGGYASLLQAGISRLNSKLSPSLNSRSV